MAAHAAVGVDDDLAAGEAAVALGPADHEAAGGVDEVLGLLVEQLGGDDRLDDLLEDVLAHGLDRARGSLCWVETITASTRTGLSPSYSTVTWLLPSGRR